MSRILSRFLRMESLRCFHGSGVWDLGLGVCPCTVAVTKSLRVCRIFEV